MEANLKDVLLGSLASNPKKNPSLIPIKTFISCLEYLIPDLNENAQDLNTFMRILDPRLSEHICWAGKNLQAAKKTSLNQFSNSKRKSLKEQNAEGCAHQRRVSIQICVLSSYEHCVLFSGIIYFGNHFKIYSFLHFFLSFSHHMGLEEKVIVSLITYFDLVMTF